MIAYGMACTWHDDKANVAVDRGLPCCPHCKGLLFEMTEPEWLVGVAKHNVAHPGYARFIVWAKGKCHPNFKAAWDEFNALH